MIAPPPLVAYASELAGHPVAVGCLRNQSFPGGELGYTQYTGEAANPVYFQVIYLPTATCNRIVAILTPASRVGATVSTAATTATVDPGADGDALETILHEATHLRENSTDEARVECDTYLNRWQAVAPLKLPAWRAKATLSGMAASHLASPDAYLVDC